MILLYKLPIIHIGFLIFVLILLYVIKNILLTNTHKYEKDYIKSKNKKNEDNIINNSAKE